jgi:hypothetical protein
MEKDKLIARYPRLYHMAEVGSWQNILQHGLLSTVAALDRFEVGGMERVQLESRHRPEKVTLQGAGLDKVVLRDQKPMSEQRLAGALMDGLTPQQWYETINSKVFFWVQSKRLERLLSARAYRKDEHDVFTMDTKSFVNSHEHVISLCHMNSGNTFPMPFPRGMQTFQRIENYSAKPNGGPSKEVVELVVDYSVPDIAKHVIEIRRMKGTQVIQKMFP